MDRQEYGLEKLDGVDLRMAVAWARERAPVVLVTVGGEEELLQRLLFWLIVGPPLAGFVGTGVPWLALVVRDFRRSPGQVWNEARSWLLVVVGFLALAFGVVAITLLMT